jgi:conjugal transfer/entry exclusion protein
MSGNANELAILVTIIGVVVAASAIIVEQLKKVSATLDKIADRARTADDLIIEKLDAIVWQSSEMKNRLYSIDERLSRYSQNQQEQFVGEMKEFLDKNSVPLDKTND